MKKRIVTYQLKDNGDKQDLYIDGLLGDNIAFICQLIEEGKIEPDFFKRNATTDIQTLNLDELWKRKSMML